KLCAFLLLDAEGSEISLEPFDHQIHKPVSLDLPSNRLVLFREDFFAYSYTAKGTGSALQTHMMTESVVPNSREKTVVTVPTQLMNDSQAMIRSMACHYPGDARHQESYWLVALGGADGLVKVPVTRWDATEYFSADEKEGFTYAIHGGFCADEDVIMFDNAFFGLSEEE
ncbi:swnK, partial [Symbiodinium sp. CCMP2456]